MPCVTQDPRSWRSGGEDQANVTQLTQSLIYDVIMIRGTEHRISDCNFA